MNFKIKMMSGQQYSLNEEQVREFLENQKQLVPIYENGKWAGVVINKASVESISPDMETSRYNEGNALLGEPKGSSGEGLKKLGDWVKKNLA